MTDAKRGEHGVRDAIDLWQAARAERREDRGKSEQAGQPGEVEPPLHIIHRATRDGPVGQLLPILVRECHLHHLGRHAQGGRHQHPKHRRRPA